MTHVNRWRTITATATTAVLAAGAFGIAAAVEGSGPADPAGIEMASEATLGEPVENSASTLDRSVQSTASQVSEESAEEALSALSEGQDVAGTELRSDATASISGADATSVPSEVSESAENSVSLPTEDTESAEDSVSIEDSDDEGADQAIAPAGDDPSPSPDVDDTASVDDGDEGSPDSAS